MTQNSEAPTSSSADGPALDLVHDTSAWSLWPVVVVNALLNIVTASLYRFWAKTRVRRFLWSGTVLAGDRLEYSGTGKELFLGFLIVLVALLIPLVVLNFAVQILFGHDGQFVMAAVLYPGALFLLGVALYRARRYRLSRTSWRGIRPALVGSEWRYGALYLGLTVLNIVTLGWSYPWSRLVLAARIMNDCRFGDRPFRFEGGAGPLYPRFALAWAGAVAAFLFGGAAVAFVAGGIGKLMELKADDMDEERIGAFLGVTAFSLGILVLPIAALIAWYKAREFNYLAESTTYEGLRFRFRATAWSLIWLLVGNVLIVFVTLSFGQPFAQLRTFRYACRRLSADGSVDFEAIRQSAAARPSVGEGLADAFDVGSV